MHCLAWYNCKFAFNTVLLLTLSAMILSILTLDEGHPVFLGCFFFTRLWLAGVREQMTYSFLHYSQLQITKPAACEHLR